MQLTNFKYTKCSIKIILHRRILNYISLKEIINKKGMKKINYLIVRKKN